jgi:very-short-patch-repair endonuclease
LLYPDDPRSLNTNDAELRLDQHLEAHPQVKSFSKNAIDCGGRKLVPDAIVEIEGKGTVMIELDGPQHFGFVHYFHPNGEEDFHDQIRRDCAKNLYAREQGWGLLRISYKEYKDLEQIVDQFIGDFIKGGRVQLFRVSNATLYNGVPRELF